MVHQVIHLSRYPVHFTAHCEDAMCACLKLWSVPVGWIRLPIVCI